MKWKYLYFALNAKDQQLCFYENEKRVKPKGLVDLSYTYLYPVHDSLFERAFCFQLVERTIPCISTYYYLAADSAESALVRHFLCFFLFSFLFSSICQLPCTAYPSFFTLSPHVNISLIL